jgi:hypothetical protein
MSARPSLALLLTPLLALAAACADPPTEIVLVVDTGLAVPAELDAITIDVTGPTGMERKIATLGPGGTALPLTLGLTRAEGAALSPIGIVVIGQRGGAEIIRRVVSTDFVEGESRLLRVVLVAECLAPRDCGAGNTCSEAGCIPERIRGGTLPPFAAVPRRFDGGSGVVERCNGVDDDGDTMIDEGFDLQSETQNCGACGNDCSTKPGVVGARCERGACVIQGCAANRGDCDMDAENGCEVDLLTDVDHCGSCIGACQALNGAPTCSGGTCSIDCTPGFADCDASPASGCEANLSDLNSCGRCANRCDMRCGAGYCDDTRVTALAVGGSHGCALRERGTVVCWGANASGQLGDATTTVRRQPVDVRALTDARSLAAGDAHTCVIRATGGVACWGEGDLGRLGDSGTTDRNTPVAVMDLTGATQLAGGGAHTCALVTDGTVRCWGANMRGQLGDASLATRVRPVAVSGVADVRAITAGEAHSCALRTDGTVVCWGENRSGQLGDASMPGDPSEMLSNVARPVAEGEPHVRAAHERRGAVLGQGHERPARHRGEHDERAHPRLRRAPDGRERDRRRRGALLRGAPRRHRALLGAQRSGPARQRQHARRRRRRERGAHRRDAARQPDGHRGRRRSRCRARRRHQAHLRAHPDGGRVLLGLQQQRPGRRRLVDTELHPRHARPHAAFPLSITAPPRLIFQANSPHKTASRLAVRA